MSALSWVTSPRIKLWLSWCYKAVKGLLGTVDYKTMAIQILAAAMGETADKVVGWWDALEELAKKAAVLFPGSGRGDEKYKWVFQEFTKQVGTALRALFVDKILHEVLTYLESNGHKT